LDADLIALSMASIWALCETVHGAAASATRAATTAARTHLILNFMATR
jgi:hypothetical protein